MVARARQAMIVPQSVQGGANGCMVASYLQSSRDLYRQSAAMEKKSKGAAEDGRQGEHETVVAWQRATSESSISSMDSMHAGEPVFSPSESFFHRKARLALHTSESDEESMLDSVHEDFLSKKARRPYLGGAVQPHSAASLILDEAVADHGSIQSDDGKDHPYRVKFMCSFGGKIFPRPSDGKLRYVGGDNKLIAVNRDTNFFELMAKMTEVYGEALNLKYQLPDEDLDALVSVSSDEDLQNMMEEYDKLERADGSSRLRVFLFPTVDYDSGSHHNDSTGDLRNSEQRYVDAVNGIPEVGSRGRTDSHSGSAPTFSMENLLGLDVPDTWNMTRGQEAVPVALVPPQAAHDIASHILRVPTAVPVSTTSSRSNVPSAPSSAPSSPPLLPRQAHAKLPIPSDIHHQYHQDTHVKLGAQYNVLVAEGVYQENEGFIAPGATSTGSQHDPLPRSSDSRRGPDSPPRKQHEGVHPDHSLRAEQRPLSETKVPRVGSHGKLTRLGEHVELAPSNETQQLPDLLEMQRLLQPQQQPLHQAVWQHPMDPQHESYRRGDLLQSTVTQNAVLGQQHQGYQQHQPVVFRPGLPQGLPTHEAGYRQGDQQHQYPEEVIHHMTRSGSSHTMTPGVPSVQPASYHVGSAPSSPRVGFREVPSRHGPGPQQLPFNWAFSGSAFTEQQPSYGKRINYGDQSRGRSFRLSNSPPKFRDQLFHSDERELLLRQQQQQQQQALGNPEALHHDQVPKSAQLLYETNPVGQPYDLLSRPQVPLYKGMNPFQEKTVPYQDHQEIGDSRRLQLSQQGIDSQFLPGQRHLHPVHPNQRLDYHDPLIQHPDQLSGNSRYPDNQMKIPERNSDEARLGFRGRGRPVTLEDELHVDSGIPHHRETQQSSYAGLHLPETSDDLLSGPVGDFTSYHNKGDRLDHAGTSGFPYRPGMLPPSALGGYAGPKLRTNLPDSSGVPRYVTRSNESDYLVAGLLRAGGNIQDPRTTMYDVNGHPHTSSGLGPGLQYPPPFHRLEEWPAGTAFAPITQPIQNLCSSDIIIPGNEILWSGGLGPDDVRIEPSQGRDLLGSFYEDRLQGIQNLAMNRGASRLSRPSSSTNIPNLVEERGDNAYLHSYGTQDRGSSLIDEDALNQYSNQSILANESLFSLNSARQANPPPAVDMAPPISTDMLAFDPTPVNSVSSVVTTRDDLPNIKTIATQVPSKEGDESGGSTSTTGGSDHSLSNRRSSEIFLGHLTMTQHLAEDMASCVLERSPIKMGVSQRVHQESFQESTVAQDQSSWPRDPQPTTLSPNLWENALDDAMVTNFKDGNNDEDLEEEDSPQEDVVTTTSITRDEEVEKIFQKHLGFATPESEKEDTVPESTVDSMKEDSTGKNTVDDAAAEAIAHGLQTIKDADLEELRELGSGTFGTVYHGKWRGTDVAIKRIKSSCFAGRPSEQERLVADFWREACNLGNLHHPNVVAFYGVVSDGPGGTLATVTEYMVNGSLKQVLQKKDRTIDRRKRLLIAMDSAFGMEYLHGKNIVHFDLKCENLLVNMRDPHRPICKVGDLGLSKVKHQTMVSGGVRGTLPWMAPELLNGSSSLVTEKVDVFSFGIVMWELLTGEEPYANMHYGAIIGGIVNNTLRPPIPTWCDPGWRSLMQRCWSSEPVNRPAFSEIASELRGMSEALKPKAQPPSQGQPPATA